ESGRRAARARRRGRRAVVAAGRPGSPEPREGHRTDAVGGRPGRDQAEHPSRLPLDVPRLRAGAPEVRPDRERADEERAGEARGRRPGVFELRSHEADGRTDWRYEICRLRARPQLMRPGRYGRKPRSRAKTIAWARVQTPSLSNRFETWLRTVFS